MMFALLVFPFIDSIALYVPVYNVLTIKVAKNTKRSKVACRTGFGYMVSKYNDGREIFRKKKLLYVRTYSKIN